MSKQKLYIFLIFFMILNSQFSSSDIQYSIYENDIIDTVENDILFQPQDLFLHGSILYISENGLNVVRLLDTTNLDLITTVAPSLTNGNNVKLHQTIYSNGYYFSVLTNASIIKYD